MKLCWLFTWWLGSVIVLSAVLRAQEQVAPLPDDAAEAGAALIEVMDADQDPEVVVAVDPEPDPEPDETSVRQAPKAFPGVTRVADSTPRYAAFRADPWDKNRLYLMFDGEVTNGYNRLYLWIPDHRQYDQPTPLMGNSDGWFPELRFEETDGDGVFEVAYRFRFTRQTHRAGGPARAASSRTVFDYQTGQTRTVSVPARPASPVRTWLTPEFSFSATVMRDQRPLGGANRMALSLAGSFNTVSKFEEIKGATAPWNGVVYNLAVRRDQQANPQNVILNAKGAVRYGNHGRCSIQTLPPGFMEVTLTVNPYMGQPVASVVSGTHNGLDLITDGIDVSVPFGWYTASWKAVMHPWLGGREYSGTTGLMALGRPTEAVTVGGGGLGTGGSPASQLRGPPPSQLRGPGNR